jgi:hypothetical protein
MALLAQPNYPGTNSDDTPDYRKQYLSQMRDFQEAIKEEAAHCLKLSPEYDKVKEYISYL